MASDGIVIATGQRVKFNIGFLSTININTIKQIKFRRDTMILILMIG